ncbi:MAG: Asp-tRNA(Asn)/Glu-tRNA(Gln) amidotransferase subunit GatC [Acidobacteriota bacterium]
MSVDSKVVDHVASLAKLCLDEDERRLMADELGRILEYVEQLRQVDVTDILPTKHVIDICNVSRPDTPRPSLLQEEAMANAPETEAAYFVVPKVLPD